MPAQVAIKGFAPLTLATHLGLALAMAVFVGLAFEEVYKQEPSAPPGGIRTFPLLTLLGSVLYLIGDPSLSPFLVGLAAVAIWLYAHLRGEYARETNRPTLVVPAVNLLTYGFGPAALTQPSWVLVAAAVAAVLLVESRAALHRLAQRVSGDEVYTLGKFLILVGVILPLIPDRPIVSWTPITPLQVWLALLAVSSLSYFSYLLQGYVPSSGALTPSLLGGAYSSTATTVVLARAQRGAETERPELTVGIVVATAVMYLRIDVVVALFNRPLALLLLPPTVGMFVLTAAIAALMWWRRPKAAAPAAGKLTVANPLQLLAAVTFAALFVAMALASSWVRTTFGRPGVFGLAAISGVTDIDPFVLNLAQGSVAGMSLGSLAAAILIAASSNNVLKAVYAVTFGSLRTCRKPAAALLAVAVAGLAIALLY